jgi:hypothetical protein
VSAAVAAAEVWSSGAVGRARGARFRPSLQGRPPPHFRSRLQISCAPKSFHPPPTEPFHGALGTRIFLRGICEVVALLDERK